MFDDLFSNYIEDLEEKFRFFLKNGKSFYASEEDFVSLVSYYSFNNKEHLMQKALELGLKYYPRSSDLLFQKGLSCFDNRRYDEAKKYFVQAYVYDSEDAHCLRYLVLLCIKQQNFDEANSYFKKLLDVLREEIDDWDIFYHANEFFWEVLDEEDLWYIFTGNKELSTTEQYLLNYSEQIFDLVNVDNTGYELLDLYYERLATFYASKNNFDIAKKYLIQSIEENPYASNSWLFLALLQLKENEYDAALNSIGYAVAIDEEIGSEQFVLAKMLVYFKRYNEAIPILEKQKEVSEQNKWELYYLLGFCYASVGEYLLAIDYYQKCTRIKPKNITPYLEIAGICLETNKLQKAYEFLQQCKKIDPHDSELNYLLADYFLKIKRYSAGLKHIDKALNEYPYDLDYVLLKSELLVASNNVSEGINVLSRYLFEHQEVAIIYYRIAGLYFEMNKVDKAYRYLKQGVQKDASLIKDFFVEYPEAKKIKKLALFLNLLKNN